MHGANARRPCADARTCSWPNSGSASGRDTAARQPRSAPASRSALSEGSAAMPPLPPAYSRTRSATCGAALEVIERCSRRNVPLRHLGCWVRVSQHCCRLYAALGSSGWPGKQPGRAAVQRLGSTVHGFNTNRIIRIHVGQTAFKGTACTPGVMV